MRTRAILLLATLLVSHALWAATPRYPEDPFSGEYRPPKARELGTTAGQVRLACNLGAQVNKSPQLLVQCGAEVMTWAFLGIRATTLFTAKRFGHSSPHAFALRVGPSIHVIPFSRVDLAAFFEGGAQAIEPFGKTWMAVIAGGLTFTISLSSYWFVQLEGQVSWGVYKKQGQGQHLVGVNLFAGAGVQL
ncbi:MAG: hypothetical protein KC609_25970 [Myxococcales bacterium]|nr:hypothetical protein [Myxococcales bacterium]